MVSRGKPSDRDMRGLRWRRRRRRLWLGRRKVFELRSVRECGARNGAATAAAPHRRRALLRASARRTSAAPRSWASVRGIRRPAGECRRWRSSVADVAGGKATDCVEDAASGARGCASRSSRSASLSRRRSRPRLRAADRAGFGLAGPARCARSRRGSARRRRRRRLLRRPGDRSGKAEILKLARPDGVGRRRIGRRRIGALRERRRLAERQSRRQHYQPQAQTRSHRLPLMP